MIIVESTYCVLNLVGGPFDGRQLFRSAALPTCTAHCEGDDGLVHVYAPIGASLFYADAYQMVRFPNVT